MVQIAHFVCFFVVIATHRERTSQFLHLIAQDCTRLHQIALDCTRLHQVALDCTRLNQIELDCTRLHYSADNLRKHERRTQLVTDFYHIPPPLLHQKLHLYSAPRKCLFEKKIEYLQGQPQGMSRIKWFSRALNFTEKIGFLVVFWLRTSDRYDRNLGMLQASRLLNEVNLIHQKDGIYKMSIWLMQLYFISFVSNSWELYKWHFVLYPSFLLCQFFL